MSPTYTGKVTGWLCTSCQFSKPESHTPVVSPSGKLWCGACAAKWARHQKRSEATRLSHSRATAKRYRKGALPVDPQPKD